MLLFLCSWLTGRPGWGCVLYFVVKLLSVVALDSSHGVCFQKELLPLGAPVGRLFPQKLECCGWWWQAEEGHDQPPEKRSVPSKTPNFNFSGELAAVPTRLGCAPWVCAGAARCSRVWSCFQLCSDSRRKCFLYLKTEVSVTVHRNVLEFVGLK